MGLRAFAHKVKNAVVEIVDNSDKEGKIIDYGKGNTFPNQLIDKIKESGTATQAIEKRITFIGADGFNDVNFASKIINLKKQTADAVLADLVPDVATFEGGALLIKYALDGVTPSVEHISLEHLRKVNGGGFVYNKKFGSKHYKKKNDKVYEEWKPDLTPSQRLAIIAKENQKYGGQRGTILYFFITRPGKRIYPEPSYYSDEEDIRSDSGLQKIDNSNIEDGFKADIAFYTLGQKDNSVKGPDGKTAQESFDDVLAEFQEPGGRRVIEINADTSEGLGKMEVLDTAPIYDATDKASDRIPRRLCRAMGVPPVLIGMDAATVLGNQQALANSVHLMNFNMLPFQALITEQFQRIYPNEKDVTISTLNVFEYIDANFIKALTPDEQRAKLGLPPLSTGEPTEFEKVASKLAALSPLVANKVLESMDRKEIRAIVGLTTTDNQPAPPAP